jgi:hypothetical protein
MEGDTADVDINLEIMKLFVDMTDREKDVMIFHAKYWQSPTTPLSCPSANRGESA